jgi:hypothetical protein
MWNRFTRIRMCSEKTAHGRRVSIMLFGLYNQLAQMRPDEKLKHDPNGKRVSTFFYNAWSAIDDLEVFLGPRLRNVQALISAVSSSSIIHRLT